MADCVRPRNWVVPHDKARQGKGKGGREKEIQRALEHGVHEANIEGYLHDNARGRKVLWVVPTIIQ